MKLTTLQTLAALEEEMARAGRTREEEALRDARRSLVRSVPTLLTTGQAAERLGISIPTVKRWIERGVLVGQQIGGRWQVASESVERLERVRESLLALDHEGNPTSDEVHSMFGQPHRASEMNRAEDLGA